MAVKVAINGFGRIGRLVLRSILEQGRRDIDVVAVNDLADPGTNAHLLKYDSVHGRLDRHVESREDAIVVDGKTIKAFQEKDPANLPWKDLGVEIALECSGVFTKREGAQKHLTAGAGKVLVSAPATDEDITLCYGVNHDQLSPDHKVVSNASCTTNCLAPVAYVVDQAVGIEHGFMTTIHSYTGDQRTVDTMHKDLHRARAAATNIIPTSTGAARAVGKVLPHLKGKLDGVAMRVPTPNVSLIDFKFRTQRPTSVQAVNDAVTRAADGQLKGILGYYDEPLVSTDFNHSSLSSVVSLPGTTVMEDHFVRVMAWYDNEWGFATRMSDSAVALAKAG